MSRRMDCLRQPFAKASVARNLIREESGPLFRLLSIRSAHGICGIYGKREKWSQLCKTKVYLIIILLSLASTSQRRGPGELLSRRWRGNNSRQPNCDNNIGFQQMSPNSNHPILRISSQLFRRQWSDNSIERSSSSSDKWVEATVRYSGVQHSQQQHE